MSHYLVALIRHGAYQQKPDTPSALQPYPLTVAGAKEVRRQAQLFAEVLKENGWQIYHEVHSSPLLRAWQTAQIYIEELSAFFKQIPVHLEFPDLTERSVGTVANLTIQEIEQIIAQDPRYPTPPKDWKSDSHYCLPFMGAESLLQAGDRVASHIEILRKQRIKKEQPDNEVQLIIGHGAAIRHAACHLSVMELWQVKGFSMFHGHPVVLAFEQQESDEGKWQHVAGHWKQRKQGEEAKD